MQHIQNIIADTAKQLDHAKFHESKVILHIQ